MTTVEEIDDRMVVKAILLRDQKVTQQYLYNKCYPLFKSIYENYYTDCQSCIEFINEIYIHLMTPNKKTGMCKLQTFQFSSTLMTWIKTVGIYYCYERFRRKKGISFVEEKNETGNQKDRFERYASSFLYEEDVFWDREDLETILRIMPNKRYSMIIRLRYLEGLSNEETATALHMNMDNYYNKHCRAKKQFNDVLNKEKRYGKIL